MLVYLCIPNLSAERERKGPKFSQGHILGVMVIASRTLWVLSVATYYFLITGSRLHSASRLFLSSKEQVQTGKGGDAETKDEQSGETIGQPWVNMPRPSRVSPKLPDHEHAQTI